ncbi:MAG: aspartate 1-decarboxylase [Helicobacteraceae bacterium]|nr:aspartate 1-decarboxylase [Helicobacteraceae bacterium]
MIREMMCAKIHRATVTDANLNYVGSITIDEALLEASGILVGQKVEVLDINNGERFSTYAIKGERHSGKICLNGAAARKVCVGDKVIIVCYCMLDQQETLNYKPTIVMVDENNTLTQVLHEI